MNRLLSAAPLWQSNGLVTLRIVTGLLMAYHGLEVFDSKLMSGYLEWDSIKSLPAPEFMIYLGKGLELVTGICLALGLFTRISHFSVEICHAVCMFIISRFKQCSCLFNTHN